MPFFKSGDPSLFFFQPAVISHFGACLLPTNFTQSLTYFSNLGFSCTTGHRVHAADGRPCLSDDAKQCKAAAVFVLPCTSCPWCGVGSSIVHDSILCMAFRAATRRSNFHQVRCRPECGSLFKTIPDTPRGRTNLGSLTRHISPSSFRHCHRLSQPLSAD